MGVFSVPLEIANLDGHEFIAVEAVVDTGSSYTVVGEDLLNGLGVRRTITRRFELGDDSVVEYAMGNALLRLEGEEMSAPGSVRAAGRNGAAGRHHAANLSPGRRLH